MAWQRIHLHFLDNYALRRAISYEMIDYLHFCSVTSAPTDLTAVQSGPTSILVSWSPSSDATGYRIHYNSSGGHSGSETVSGGSTDHYQRTGLHNGDNYTISIVAISQHQPSQQVIVDTIISLGKF